MRDGTPLSFPSPEPWPTELFASFGLRDLEQMRHDLDVEIARRKNAAAPDANQCPDCGDIAHPAQTTCESCGARLIPSNSNGSTRSDLDGTSAGAAEEVNLPMTEHSREPRCSCGQRGTCTVCILASYDRDPFAQALEQAVDIVTRPANVVALPGYSRRVS